MKSLESALIEHTDAEAHIYRRKPYDSAQRERWQSVHYWYWEHWKFFRSEVKTSIVQGIAVFLSLFETDADVRRVFCPPKELYEGTPCVDDPHGRVLPPFDELIESGKVVGLNFPVALNPALAKTVGTLMKVDYQRAVQLRIPRMDSETRHDISVRPCSSAMSTRTSPPWAETIRPATNGFCPSPGSQSAFRSSPRRACPLSKRLCPMKA